MPTCLTKKKKPVVSKDTKRVRNKVVNAVAQHVINGNLDITNYYQVYPWLTRHMVNGCIRRIKKHSNDVTDKNTISVTSITIENKICGRPKGTTTASKLDLEQKIRLAKDKMSILYDSNKSENNGVLKQGVYQMIHDRVLTEAGINGLGININR